MIVAKTGGRLWLLFPGLWCLGFCSRARSWVNHSQAPEEAGDILHHGPITPTWLLLTKSYSSDTDAACHCESSCLTFSLSGLPPGAAHGSGRNESCKGLNVELQACFLLDLSTSGLI